MIKVRTDEAAERGATVYPSSQAIVQPEMLTSCPDCGTEGLVYVQGRNTPENVYLVTTRIVSGFADPWRDYELRDMAMLADISLGRHECPDDSLMPRGRELTNAEFQVLREAVERDGIDPSGEAMSANAAALAERGLLRHTRTMYYPTESGQRAYRLLLESGNQTSGYRY